MNIAFDDARIEQKNGTWLCLIVLDPAPARGFVLKRKERKYVAELKEFRKKRSLDANAYFWVLCDKLAEATATPKSVIYRQAIRDIGGNSDVVCVRQKAAEKLRSTWERNGIGWITETQPSKVPGCVNVTLYYGSSTYDTVQMSRLIDNIVQDCKVVGVDTMTPLELERLKEDWGHA